VSGLDFITGGDLLGSIIPETTGGSRLAFVSEQSAVFNLHPFTTGLF